MANDTQKADAAKAAAEKSEEPKLVRVHAITNFDDGTFAFRKEAKGYDVPEEVFERNEGRLEKGDAPEDHAEKARESKGTRSTGPSAGKGSKDSK